jgi:hypothetical protein
MDKVRPYQMAAPYSYLEEDMNMSSISFNSRVLDQFNSIGDSVSQIGANDASYQSGVFEEGAPLDLGQV